MNKSKANARGPRRGAATADRTPTMPAWGASGAYGPRFPRSVRTVRQRVLWLAKEGYVLAAYWLARSSNKVLVALLQRTHPEVPWKNIQFAAGPVH